MDSLLGRLDELQQLESSWRASSRKPQLVLVTGRRRVGKTALIAKFASTRRSVVFSATREAMPVQLARFAEELGSLRSTLPVPSTFATWHEAIRFVAALAEHEPLLVAFDEVPYFDEVDGTFGSVLQAAWDAVVHADRRTRLLLMLTGSSRRVMDRLTSGGGPLFGRADFHLRLEPFAFVAVDAFLRGLSAADRLMAYAVTGGYPRHLLAWDATADLESNIRSLIRPGSLLYDDAPLIVHEEFPTGLGFERILLAIGRGRHSFGEIRTEADLRIEGPLATLEQVGLVRGETPIGGPRRSPPHYEITDPYLRFWFGPLARIRQGVELGGDASLVLRSALWGTHNGWVFEDEARRHAVRLAANGSLPSAIVGRWWRTGRHPMELDVVGRSDDRVRFVGEAKWSDAQPSLREVASLRARGNDAFGEEPSRFHVLWARRRLRGRVPEDVRSFSIEDMARP